MKELATAVAAPSHCCQTIIITSHARATIFYLYGLAGLRAPLGGKSKSEKQKLGLLYAPPELQVHTEFTLLVNFAPASAGSAFLWTRGQKFTRRPRFFCL